MSSGYCGTTLPSLCDRQREVIAASGTIRVLTVLRLFGPWRRNRISTHSRHRKAFAPLRGNAATRRSPAVHRRRPCNRILPLKTRKSRLTGPR